MSVPPKRRSRSAGRRRRSHDALTAPKLTLCPDCQAPMFPHRACPACGKYRGRVIGKAKIAAKKATKKTKG